jgi:hypothetical protein
MFNIIAGSILGFCLGRIITTISKNILLLDFQKYIGANYDKGTRKVKKARKKDNEVSSTDTGESEKD